MSYKNILLHCTKSPKNKLEKNSQYQGNLISIDQGGGVNSTDIKVFRVDFAKIYFLDNQTKKGFSRRPRVVTFQDFFNTFQIF